MVAVAGMAVLGMTATRAGAQTHPATYPLNDVAPLALALNGEPPLLRVTELREPVLEEPAVAYLEEGDVADARGRD